MRRESEDYYGDNDLAAQRKVQQLDSTPHSATSSPENSTSETQSWLMQRKPRRSSRALASQLSLRQ